MDEPNDNNSQATLGGAELPEWMLRRRARMQLEASATAAAKEPADVPAATTSMVPPPAELPDSQLVHPQHAPAFASLAAKVDASSKTEAAKLSAPSTSSTAANKPAKTRSRATRQVAAPLIQVVPVAPPELDWYQSLRQRWLGRDVIGGFAVSMGAHFIGAVLLSLVVLHQQSPNQGGGFNTVLEIGGDEGGSGQTIDGSSVLDVDPVSAAEQANVETLLSASTISSSLTPTQLSLPGEIGAARTGSGGGDGKGDGQGEGDGIGDGLDVGGFKMPEGGKAVQKGSFTVWTVPDDPKPGEDYKIIIQVRYKKKDQRLSPDDVTGSVVGTDKYKLMISRHTTEIIPEANQVVVYIPGASARVRDTIRVHSAMLRENQKLEIVF